MRRTVTGLTRVPWYEEVRNNRASARGLQPLQKQQRIAIATEELERLPETNKDTELREVIATSETAASSRNEKENIPTTTDRTSREVLFKPGEHSIHEVEMNSPRPVLGLPDFPVDPVISFLKQGKELLDDVDDGGNISLVSKTAVDGVWCLNLENPGEGNAITGEMMKQLEESMRAVNRAILTNHEIMALVIRGGGLNFSFGTAESIHQEYPSGEEGLVLSRYMSSILLELKSLPIITIAALEGTTAGTGCEIAMACDFRMCAEDSIIQFSDTQQGLSTGWGGAANLSNITNPRTALLLTASGKHITADESLDLGIVDCVCEPGNTYKEAIDFIKTNLHDHTGLGGTHGEITWRRHAVRRMKENVVAATMFSELRAQEDIEARNFQKLWVESAKVMAERRDAAGGLRRNAVLAALEDWSTLTDPHAMSLPLDEDVGKTLTPTRNVTRFGIASNNVEKAFTALFARKVNQPTFGSPQSDSLVKNKYLENNDKT